MISYKLHVLKQKLIFSTYGLWVTWKWRQTHQCSAYLFDKPSATNSGCCC